MDYRKKFGGITIRKVEPLAQKEWKGSWQHQQKTPEPPMFAWVYPVCLRESKDQPQVESKHLPQKPIVPYILSPQLQPGEAIDAENETETAARNSRSNRSSTPSRNRRGGARSKPKPVRRKR